MQEPTHNYQPIEREKKVSILVPFEVKKMQRFYFANDQEILNSVIDFIIPNTSSIYNGYAATGAPFATYGNLQNPPLGSIAIKFFLCLAEIGDQNKFVFYNIPIASFANGFNIFNENQQAIPMPVRARINLGKSYIYAAQDLILPEEEPRTFNLLLRYRKNNTL